MDTVDRHPTDWRRRLDGARRDRRVRSLILALAAGIILVVLIAATNSVTGAARTISDDASALSETDEAIRAATVARTLTVLAALAMNDGTSPPSIDDINEANAILAGDSSPENTRFRSAVDDAVARIETGRVPLPEQIADVENSFGELLDVQMTRRAELADALTGSEDRLNQISSLSGLALLFVVPALAIGVYRAITKPEIEQRALAHTAAETTRTNRHRLGAIAEGLSGVRNALRLNAPAALVDQRVAEVAALAGIGADGELRRRDTFDVRAATATAVNRVEVNEAVPITGDAPEISVDHEQFITMVAGLIGCVAGRQSPIIRIDEVDAHAVVRITTPDVIADLALADAPEVFAGEVHTLDEQRIAAARSLATDLGATITAIDDGRFTGFELRLPVSAGSIERRHAPEPIGAR